MTRQNDSEVSLLIPAAHTNQPKQSATVKVTSSGIGTVLTSFNTTVNCLMMIALGANAACSLSTTYQSLFRNVCSGALLSSGVLLGRAIGKGDYAKASEIVVASYVLTAILTLFSSIAYGASYFIFPELFSSSTASDAFTYLFWSGLGTFPSLALITTGQIAFQAGDWKSQLISTIAYRIPAVIFSYFFVDSLNLGVEGIGIGNAIAPWLSYIGMECWLKRAKFEEFKKLAILSLNNIKTTSSMHLKSLSTLGLQMSLQKITEWGNIMAIAFILGKMADTNLAAMNPSLQLMNFFNLLSQGIGQGGNMILAIKHSRLTTLIDGFMPSRDAEMLNEMRVLQKSIARTSIKSLAVGVTLNAASSVILLFFANDIIDLFIPGATLNKSVDLSATRTLSETMPIVSDIHDLANTLLWINVVGLVFDAVRIISACLLNTWNKILTPNIISFGLMTFAGIPLNYVVSMKKDNNETVISMFIIRTVMIAIAAIINVIMLYRSIAIDQKEINKLTGEPANFEAKSCCLWDLFGDREQKPRVSAENSLDTISVRTSSSSGDDETYPVASTP